MPLSRLMPCVEVMRSAAAALLAESLRSMRICRCRYKDKMHPLPGANIQRTNVFNKYTHLNKPEQKTNIYNRVLSSSDNFFKVSLAKSLHESIINASQIAHTCFAIRHYVVKVEKLAKFFF
uniref:Uncharacterized protein n=1 Tax=Rhipicephalus zambeziensis TaxID=60191 RepID=A0A224YFB7_9ACAR